MTGKTHLIGGVATGVAAQYFTGFYVQDPIFLGACASGALLPDICHGGSKIGRKLPLLSKTISLIFGHRTVTHSLAFLVLLAVLLFTLPVASSIQFGILIGAMSHLVLDAATTRGIELLWPLDWKARLPIHTRTGGMVEHVLFVVLVVAAVWMGAKEFHLIV